MKDTVINQLENFDFHDVCVKSLSFDFEEKSAKLEFLVFEESTQDYFSRIFIFKNVTTFFSDYPQEIDFQPEGCFSAKYHQLDNQHYEINFIFELYKDLPVWKVKIVFQDLKSQLPYAEKINTLAHPRL